MPAAELKPCPPHALRSISSWSAVVIVHSAAADQRDVARMDEPLSAQDDACVSAKSDMSPEPSALWLAR